MNFIEYSEISQFNPQSESFYENVKFQLFKKCNFVGGGNPCDVENRV